MVQFQFKIKLNSTSREEVAIDFPRRKETFGLKKKSLAHQQRRNFLFDNKNTT